MGGESGEAEDKGRTTASPFAAVLLLADVVPDTDDRCSSKV
jgi:hypothetical protein